MPIGSTIPLARRLSTWPANPPAFDPLLPGAPLFVPVAPGVSESCPQIVAGSLRRGMSLTVAKPAAHPALLAPHPGRAAPGPPMSLLDGTPVASIELRPDASLDSGSDDEAGAPADPSAASTAELSEWIDRLSDAGVCVNRHGCPDLFGQLYQALRRPVDTVVCAVLDVDASACVQNALAARHGADLVAGVRVLRRATGAGRSIIALDATAPAGWHSELRAAARASGDRVVELVNEYPQSDPTLILYTLLGRRLRPGRLPAEQGVILLDAAAAIAVGAATLRGERLLAHSLAVRHHDRAESYFITAPIGARLTDVLERLGIAGGDDRRPVIARGGDALRDLRIDTRTAVLGGGSEVVVHLASPPPAVNPLPCVRCGWCFEACPTRVQPANVLEAAQRGDPALARRAGIDACVECGACSYVCPSHLPILAGIRAIRHGQQPVASAPRAQPVISLGT
jgi:electron transport complex protein RnfC